MSHWGLSEILVVLIAALIFFGPRRLPEIGRALGSSIREFRDSFQGGAGATPPAQPNAPSAPSHEDAKGEETRG
ncbi:MAG: twin-arginine translocase TatA/TatE family subunit [Firmicutes bacterium]|nr:twin-arginine translocase TatA/TatE family subunit [Bacillota bacterium]